MSLSDGPWSAAPARDPLRAVTLRLLRVFSICLTVSSNSDTISRYLDGGHGGMAGQSEDGLEVTVCGTTCSFFAGQILLGTIFCCSSYLAYHVLWLRARHYSGTKCYSAYHFVEHSESWWHVNTLRETRRHEHVELISNDKFHGTKYYTPERHSAASSYKSIGTDCYLLAYDALVAGTTILSGLQFISSGLHIRARHADAQRHLNCLAYPFGKPGTNPFRRREVC